MPIKKCLWCGSAITRVRGGYQCPDCGQFTPLPNHVGGPT